jgi:Ca-activated chloride channel family protein
MTFGAVSFEWPLALWGLALVPLLFAVYLLLQRRRRRYAVRFTNLDLLANVVTETPRFRRHLPPLLTLLALASLVVAVARPHADLKTPKERATVMLVTDVSGSMQATDVKPDRISAAREAARTFSEQIPKKFRLGLVSFNQQSQVLVPPSTDRTLVTNALNGLQAAGGTAVGDAIETSLTSLRDLTQKAQNGNGSANDRKRRTPAVIVLLSDGKNTGGTDPVQVARQAKQRGVSINTVALGTPDGTVQMLDENGFPNVIPVPPDPESLKKIAGSTGGRFFDAPDADELKSIYERLGSRIGYDTERKEITVAFAGAGLGLMMIGGMMSLLWFGRLP